MVLPAIAWGATVETGDFSGELEINAPAGEANDLVLTGSRQGGATTIEVAELGSTPLVAGAGCEASKSGVRCELDSLRIVFAELEDMDDRLDGSLAPDDVQITADLGAGDDHMTGPLDQACVDAGEGDDTVVLIEPSGACSIDGEAGDDLLRSHSGRTTSTAVPGWTASSEPGGTDNINGGKGDDRLIARGGADFIDDGGGADRVSGGEGSEFFADDPGDDVLRGEEGADVYGCTWGLATVTTCRWRQGHRSGELVVSHMQGLSTARRTTAAS